MIYYHRRVLRAGKFKNLMKYIKKRGISGLLIFVQIFIRQITALFSWDVGGMDALRFKGCSSRPITGMMLLDASDLRPKRLCQLERVFGI